MCVMEAQLRGPPCTACFRKRSGSKMLVEHMNECKLFELVVNICMCGLQHDISMCVYNVCWQSQCNQHLPFSDINLCWSFGAPFFCLLIKYLICYFELFSYFILAQPAVCSYLNRKSVPDGSLSSLHLPFIPQSFSLLCVTVNLTFKHINKCVPKNQRKK